MIRKYPSKKEEMEKMEAEFDKQFKQKVDSELEAPSLTPRQDMLRTVERGSVCRQLESFSTV